jgi:hypothetical protein
MGHGALDIARPAGVLEEFSTPTATSLRSGRADMTDRLLMAYSDWRNATFPPGSSRDDVDEAHAELATLDYWVADNVVPFLENGIRVPLKVDIEGGIQRLLLRLRDLKDSSDNETRERVESYSHYLQLLDAVLRAYQQEP